MLLEGVLDKEPSLKCPYRSAGLRGKFDLTGSWPEGMHGPAQLTSHCAKAG